MQEIWSEDGEWISRDSYLAALAEKDKKIEFLQIVRGETIKEIKGLMEQIAVLKDTNKGLDHQLGLVMAEADDEHSVLKEQIIALEAAVKEKDREHENQLLQLEKIANEVLDGYKDKVVTLKAEKEQLQKAMNRTLGVLYDPTYLRQMDSAIQIIDEALRGGEERKP